MPGLLISQNNTYLGVFEVRLCTHSQPCQSFMKSVLRDRTVEQNPDKD